MDNSKEYALIDENGEFAILISWFPYTNDLYDSLLCCLDYGDKLRSVDTKILLKKTIYLGNL